MNIILYLLHIIQYQHKQICWLLNFICRFIPLKQWAFEDSHSPKYQKFKTDELPVIKNFVKQDWQFLLKYYEWKYHKTIKPVQRRNGRTIPEEICCPVCGAPHHFLYDNNGNNGQYQCKVCGHTFTSGEYTTTPLRFFCPYCSHSLVPKKDRSFFRVHKCVNPKCPYYLYNLSKVESRHLKQDYGKINISSITSTVNLLWISLRWTFPLFRKMHLLLNSQKTMLTSCHCVLLSV